MAAVRGTDTKPELVVRRLLHSQGYRFRLHRRDLPGRPDIVLPKYRTCILVHGCFWHQHPGCKRATVPKSNEAFWRAKFERNQVRDGQVASELEEAGWKVITIWECQTKNQTVLKQILSKNLQPPDE